MKKEKQKINSTSIPSAWMAEDAQMILKELKLSITEGFGKKCKEYNPFCGCCIVWSAYETLEEGFNND